VAREDEQEITEEAATSGGSQDLDDGEETGEDVTLAHEEMSEQDAFDHAAESFVELEQELKGGGEGIRGRGRAVDVDRVPTTEVPDDYPAPIETEEALALRLSMVEADDATVVVYFEWPEQSQGQGPDERLAKLLDLCDIPTARFADLHGEAILLTIEDGYYVPVLPDEQPRGDSRGVYGIIAGLIPSFLVAAAGIFGVSGPIGSLSFLLLWVVATFVILPVSIYLDAWDLRTTTDWDGGPLFWAFFSLVPALNVLAVPAYLIMRENAEPIA
jgi:hypothetical protein